jgi:TrwC relaxase
MAHRKLQSNQAFSTLLRKISFFRQTLRALPHMFTAVAHKSLAGAEGYFVEHLSQNDYYADGEIHPGQWIGVGTDRLGLKAGKFANREQFYALCENRHPETGNRLTLRQNEKTSAGCSSISPVRRPSQCPSWQ